MVLGAQPDKLIDERMREAAADESSRLRLSARGRTPL
jgi:hypothetical protein